jgi:NADPH-dependent 2,4-dienoyl-CoA reductase/sulfur reductase-like enzyme
VHTLRTLEDVRALRAELLPGSRLVVIGAGFIGSEIASTARSLGAQVTVVEVMATPLAGPLGTEMARFARPCTPSTACG